MKKSILISAAIFAYCLLPAAYCFSQGTAINTNGSAADNSALLDVSSNSQGALIPRMTTAERNNIVNPADGLLVFNKDCGNINYYFNGTWYPMNNGVSNIPAAAGSITGSSVVCQGQSGVSFSVGAVSGATNYLWYYSGLGATISGTTGNITTDFSPTATSGILTVIGSNACGKGIVSPNFDITVSPALPVSVSISANPAGNICPGTSVTFTATPVNGGSSPAYQWKLNGADAGTNSSVYSINPANGDAVSCIMTSNANCVYGSPDTSNVITITHYTVPTITGTTPGSRNGPGSVTLGASAPAGTINWYAAATGGSPLGTGTTFNTPSICATTTYYADATDNGCTTPTRTAVTATVNKVFQVDNGCSLTSNLVAYYKMENNSNDAWGSNNGSDNSVSYSSGYGKVNQGGSFNGSSSTIAFSAVPITTTGEWTIAAWVNPQNLSQIGMAVAVGYDDGISGNGFAMGMGDGNGFPGNKFQGLLCGVSWYNTGYTYGSSNTWYFLCAVRSGGVVRTYVNTSQTPNTDSATPNTATQFKLGSNTGIRFWNGYVDEAGIWSRALSAQEISDLYNDGAGQTIQ